MHFEALSLFPEVFDSYLNASIMGRAQRANVFSFQAYNLRNWTHDRHRTVDDAPFGGGQGMLMKPDPFFEAIDEIQGYQEVAPYVVFFSPCGRRFDQRTAEKFSKMPRILLACAHYEGVDERAYALADEVLSLGDYVLTGAELAALTVIDATVRLLPGALGDEMSAQDESFSNGLLEYAQYTRPAQYQGMDVPEVLLSGDHERIARWRHNNALERTARWRPDLLECTTLTASDEDVLKHLCQQEEN